MADQVLEERDMGIEEYLGLFDPQSVDYPLIQKRAEKLARIVVKKVADPSGRVREDTTFIEKSGIQYTVNSFLD